mmetsp:Transcript_14621/g.27449  ORF Transcript_14621/g.27449 Transcript_14621/m.27449 type:complete len:236 (-) Transcript_14621:554-1261(-)
MPPWLGTPHPGETAAPSSARAFALLSCAKHLPGQRPGAGAGPQPPGAARPGRSAGLPSPRQPKPAAPSPLGIDGLHSATSQPSSRHPAASSLPSALWSASPSRTFVPAQSSGSSQALAHPSNSSSAPTSRCAHHISFPALRPSPQLLPKTSAVAQPAAHSSLGLEPTPPALHSTRSRVSSAEPPTARSGRPAGWIPSRCSEPAFEGLRSLQRASPCHCPVAGSSLAKPPAHPSEP